eukprot:scaffold343820_cov16-Prasinocladus_malaysianus.AAC.1
MHLLSSVLWVIYGIVTCSNSCGKFGSRWNDSLRTLLPDSALVLCFSVLRPVYCLVIAESDRPCEKPLAMPLKA